MPVEIRRAALHNMQRLLPKMQLAGYAAAILHPLMRVLDGHIDELRRDAADTICAVAVALGPDFALFVPSIRRVRSNTHSARAVFPHHLLLPFQQTSPFVLTQVMMRHKKTHDKFAKMAARISMAEPPCMSNAEDWESQNGWVDEMGPPPEPEIGPPILPDGECEHPPVIWLGLSYVDLYAQAALLLRATSMMPRWFAEPYPVSEGTVYGAVNGGGGQQAVNQVALRRAWESSQRSTKEDWAEWMRHFSVELLKESPSPALRATHTLAQVWEDAAV